MAHDFQLLYQNKAAVLLKLSSTVRILNQFYFVIVSIFIIVINFILLLFHQLNFYYFIIPSLII